eukprot:COSAG06_NODE_50295_length_319_cov_2.195455_1_plen_105_part_11
MKRQRHLLRQCVMKVTKATLAAALNTWRLTVVSARSQKSDAENETNRLLQLQRKCAQKILNRCLVVVFVAWSYWAVECKSERDRHDRLLAKATKKLLNRSLAMAW